MSLISVLDNTIVTAAKDIRIPINPAKGTCIHIKHIDLTDIGRVVAADDTTDELTITSGASNKHPRTGLKVQFTTTDTLPDGLAVLTDYYCIYVSTTKCKVAATYQDALDGVAIDLLDAGDGVHTMTPVSDDTRNFALSFSCNGVDYHNVVTLNGTTAITFSAVTISASQANLLYPLADLKGITNVRCVVTMDDGQAQMSFIVNNID